MRNKSRQDIPHSEFAIPHSEGSAFRIHHSAFGHALAIAFAFLLYIPWLWQLFANGGQALGIVFFPLTLDGRRSTGYLCWQRATLMRLSGNPGGACG